jgi:hypothetical protein
MLKLVIMSLKKLGGSLAPENTDSVRPSMASSAFWSFVKPEQWQPGQIEKKKYIPRKPSCRKKWGTDESGSFARNFSKSGFF